MVKHVRDRLDDGDMIAYLAENGPASKLDRQAALKHIAKAFAEPLQG